MLNFSVTFLITIINLTVLFFILRAILFKPVTKFMAERAKRIQDSIDQAEKDRAEAKELLAEYESKLKGAEAEAEEIIKTAREKSGRLAEQIAADGKREAENIILSARKQIEAELEAAAAKFTLEAAALVMAASAKLAARDFGGEDNKRYVKMLLDELSAQKGKR
ncbi:MAG: ATP synthase F0 subunit B [Treponema sp.]|nr:ATP synthase F0 subunit B [Treponema sp.]